MPPEVPIVAPFDLPPACPGEVYTATFAATGGGNYAWSALLPAELGLELSPSGVLSGVIAATGHFSLDVSVRDTATGAGSEPSHFDLYVREESATECPVIYVEGLHPSSPAPSSCVASPYFATLAILDKPAADYDWTFTEVPPGLSFDPEEQTLTGVPEDSGALTVQIEDADGRVVQRSFDVPMRESCWFAYLSNGSGVSRLNLVDPLLVDFVPSARLERPASNEPDNSVTDFKFSPDGRFIAYRIRKDDDTFALRLWQAPGWNHEQELPLAGSVTHYAWSANGQVLAAAILSEEGTQLSGVDVSAVPDDSSSAGIEGVRLLSPISVSVESEITWYGEDDCLVFLSVDSPDTLNVTYLRYDDAEFTGNTAVGGYHPSSYFYPSEAGVFIVDPDGQALDYLPAGDVVPQYHANVAADPQGQFVASAADDALDIYWATQGTFSGEEPLGTSAGCSSLLTWAGKRERLACALVDMTAEPPVASIQLHDISGSDPRIVKHDTVLDSERPVTNGSSPWESLPRLLSPSGDWLALATASEIQVANLRGDTPQMAWRALLEDSALPTQLSFSPDEQLLLAHYGTSVRLHELATGAPSQKWTAAFESPACQEGQLAQASWCGREQGRAELVWSPDSRLIGFVDADAGLLVLDLRLFPRFSPIGMAELEPDCGAGCAGTGRFQPLPDSAVSSTQ